MSTVNIVKISYIVHFAVTEKLSGIIRNFRYEHIENGGIQSDHEYTDASKHPNSSTVSCQNNI